MENKVSRNIMLPLFVLLTSVAIYFFASSNEVTKPAAKDITQPPTIEQLSGAPQKSDQDESARLTEKEVNKLNSDNQADIKQRHYLAEKNNRDRGLISPEERTIYQNYPLDTLQEMGKSGDIHALHELGQRASNEGNFALAFAHYESAAVYGSTVALGYLGDKYEMANKLHLDDKNGKHALVVATSYLRVAELRGDYSNSREIKRLPEKYERTYGKIDLDENDYREIEIRAKEIYTKMENNRIELGLEPFDNTVPEEDISQMERVLAERAKKEFGL